MVLKYGYVIFPPVVTDVNGRTLGGFDRVFKHVFAMLEVSMRSVWGIFVLIWMSLASTAVALDNVSIDRIGKALVKPWGMAPLSGNRMLVTQKTKGMVVIDLKTGAQQNIKGEPDFKVIGQGGLLDVETAQSGGRDIVFLCYSKPVSGGTTVAVTRSELDTATLTNTRDVFVSNHIGGSGRHFGCRLAVDGDDIYLSLGDRGDRDRTSQDGSNHAGSIVKLSINGSVSSAATSQWADGVHSIGHRNPQGLRIHPKTGALWSHEHGPQGGDEINIIKRGANYGWPRVSFGQEYGGGGIGEGSTAAGITAPIWVWTPSIAPSGMDFYHGAMFPEFRDHLLVGSLKFQSLYAVKLQRGQPVSETRHLNRRLGRIRDVHVLPDGSILLLNDADRGGLYRLSR